MKNYDHIAYLIDQNLEKVTFGDLDSGISDEWISKAQTRLNVVFPPSYVWWLKNYGGGEISGDEIFSIYEMDFDTVVGGDIVYINELNRKNKLTDNTQIVIQENDRSEVFYFDLSQADQHGEYPIYRAFSGGRFKYADDFSGFLKGRIEDKY